MQLGDRTDKQMKKKNTLKNNGKPKKMLQKLKEMKRGYRKERGYLKSTVNKTRKKKSFYK